MTEVIYSSIYETVSVPALVGSSHSLSYPSSSFFKGLFNRHRHNFLHMHRHHDFVCDQYRHQFPHKDADEDKGCGGSEDLDSVC